MHIPYTDRWPEAVAITVQSVSATLTAIVWHRPLRTRAASLLFGSSIWVAALAFMLPDLTRTLHLSFDLKPTAVLQLSATLATVAILLHGPRWFGVLAALGQFLLYALGEYLRESNLELGFIYLMWCGLLLGVHAAIETPPARAEIPEPGGGLPEPGGAPPRSFASHDVAIFAIVTALAAMVVNVVYARVIYNGDEVAYTYMADVFGHLRASGPIPPCPSMFENYWVFHHKGKAFSQYTPGWPLFMATFSRLGVVWLAGPVMAGILAVALARLSRRVARGLGPTPETSRRTVAACGLLGAGLAFLGPSLLLNGASRFSHTMVCACFAWSIESVAIICDRSAGGRSSRGWGFLLGASIALGLAARPADGGLLAVGVFLYFLWALYRRRVPWRTLVFAGLGAALFGGLTLIILRLQAFGTWFKTAYAIAPSIHPESELRLSFPKPNEWKWGIPMAFGSYCWWPVAPALGIAGLVRALAGARASSSVHARDEHPAPVGVLPHGRFRPRKRRRHGTPLHVARGDADGGRGRGNPRAALHASHGPRRRLAPRASARSDRRRWPRSRSSTAPPASRRSCIPSPARSSPAGRRRCWARARCG